MSACFLVITSKAVIGVFLLGSVLLRADGLSKPKSK